MTVLLQLDDVTFQYPDSPIAILDGVSLCINAGETIRITGRNGAGKSTLLKIICGEILPTAGIIRSQPNVRRIYLNQFSGDMLAMDLTVGETFDAFCDAETMGQGRQNYQELLRAFGIGLQNRLSSFCGQLSGGQRQIVALAVSIFSGASLLCLDEFTSNLDEQSEKIALDLIDKFANQSDRAVFFVSHASIGIEDRVYALAGC